MRYNPKKRKGNQNCYQSLFFSSHCLCWTILNLRYHVLNLIYSLLLPMAFSNHASYHLKFYFSSRNLARRMLVLHILNYCHQFNTDQQEFNIYCLISCGLNFGFIYRAKNHKQHENIWIISVEKNDVFYPETKIIYR